MYNDLYLEIERKLKSSGRYASSSRIKDIYLTLLYLKYVCDNNLFNCTYEKIINNENFCDFVRNNKKIYNDFISLDMIEWYPFDIKMEKLLSLIQYEDLNKLADEYLNNNYNIGLEIIPDKKYNIYIKNKNKINTFTKNKNVKYIGISNPLKSLFVMDTIFNIKHTYQNDLEFDDNVVYYDYNEPPLSFKEPNNIFKDIRTIFNKCNNKLYVKTQYRKISTFDDPYLLKHLYQIIINSNNDKDETILLFTQEEIENVSIILYDEKKGIIHLKKIMNDNKEVENELIKVSEKKIYIDNYGRIGFNMYNRKIIKEEEDIMTLINKNYRYLNEVERLNKIIDEEINKLIVK